MLACLLPCLTFLHMPLIACTWCMMLLVAQPPCTDTKSECNI